MKKQTYFLAINGKWLVYHVMYVDMLHAVSSFQAIGIKATAYVPYNVNRIMRHVDIVSVYGDTSGNSRIFSTITGESFRNN